MKKGIGEIQNLNGALRVVIYMLSQVSENRSKGLMSEIDALITKYGVYPEENRILTSVSGLEQLHRK